MHKKSIIITVIEPDLTLPDHLKKPQQIDISIDPQLSLMDCATLLNGVLTQILQNIAKQLATLPIQQNTNLKKVN